MEREMGFEPTASCLEGRRSTPELLPHRVVATARVGHSVAAARIVSPADQLFEPRIAPEPCNQPARDHFESASDR